MIAYLRREAGWEVVRALLADFDNPCVAHAVNLCEVFYDHHRSGGEAAAQAALATLAAAGVTTREDLDRSFWEDVGRIISSVRGAGLRIALGDSFGVALARRVVGEFVTADRHEFTSILPLALCPVRFIR
jgi:hypothetical protein